MPIQMNQYQIPEKAMLDRFNKQTYSGNQFAVPLAGTSLTTSESNLLLLKNPAAPIQTSKSLFLNLRKIVCLTASDTALLRVYLNPTVTGAGSAGTAVNLRPAVGVSAMIAVPTTSPSTSASGTLIDVLGSQALYPSESDTLIILDPGQSVLVTGQGSASCTIDGLIAWFEL